MPVALSVYPLYHQIACQLQVSTKPTSQQTFRHTNLNKIICGTRIIKRLLLYLSSQTVLYYSLSLLFLSSIFFSPFQWKVQANVVASKPKHHPLNPKVTAFVATMFVLVEHMGDYFLSLIFLLLVVHASSYICCDFLWQRLIVLNGNSLT